MNWIKMIAATTICLVCAVTAGNNEKSPVGFWVTFDEENGDSLAVVEIYQTEEALQGAIREVKLRPHQGKKGICARCPLPWKDQPMQDLLFMWAFPANGDNTSKGQLLNPADGKRYRAELSQIDPLTLKLEIRAGFLGFVRRSKTLLRTAQSASTGSMAGHWHMMDDRFGLPASLVEIRLVDQEWQGRIMETYLLPDEGPDAVCVACKDSLKNRTLANLQILSGLQYDGKKWHNGQILDPGNGKYYKCSIEMFENDKLIVRGHLGPFSRSQTWQRLTSAAEKRILSKAPDNQRRDY